MWNCATDEYKVSEKEQESLKPKATPKAPSYPSPTVTSNSDISKQANDVHDSNFSVKKGLSTTSNENFETSYQDSVPIDSNWWVPDITCKDAKAGPIYIQLGQAAMHRGNQGISKVKILILSMFSLLTYIDPLGQHNHGR